MSAPAELERPFDLEQRRLTKLVETMHDGLLLLDERGTIRLANAAASRLLDVADPTSMDWPELLAALHHKLAADEPGQRRLQELGSTADAVVGQEVFLTDGPVLELDFVPVRWDARQAPCGTLVHLRDVTARVAVRRGLEERSRGLEERNRALAEATALNNEFVATVAHELRGPLSSVVAFAHLLGDESLGVLSEDQRTYLDVVDRNANRLLRLIEDLLLLSRLESHSLQLKPVMTRLPELLAVAVHERVPAAHLSGIELRLDCAGGPELMCDDTRVHQVVDNLLTNALKFTPTGGRVTVTGRVEGGHWFVDVADSGVGIPAADLPRLFSAFFRGSNVSTAVGRDVMPGTGLGLVVSRAIVELHGGTISVASTEGVGTTVTFSLPAQRGGAS